MKTIYFLSVFVVILTNGFSQVKSPDQFLGYKIGSRYTSHSGVVNYFQYIANVAPGIVKLRKYGETNEHRPLYLAFISAADNISKLESIQQNNLRLAHLANDKQPADDNVPAIVWLSYNVHGNEPSSSEAAMLTLFALADPSNTQTKEWLKNTVVIIDPCLNPDGRDRYVNWFNSVLGRSYDPVSFAREHREPWPGGRSNHYNFDLNRDWAWQTQVESQQRLIQYNQWMPQVHVDFHEQSFNRPYYFAPAAEPYQEVITRWQRDFQVSIGKNHAKYFDRNGWLYYTRERYDLLYPSYGDTYPLYNGAIGMTYEQGGGPGAGLSVRTETDDTVTLYQRLLHHYTTGISTIETASLNAATLIKEYKKFFNDAVSGSVGQYNTYVIKNNPEDVERMNSLITLLHRNDIQYGTATGTAKGYNYLANKEEPFTINNTDIIISSSQPRAALIKVLFEPQTKLADSVTYDITAWSIPYSFGLTCYATKQRVPVSVTRRLPEVNNSTVQEGYGYVIRWQGMSSAKTVAQLLQKGIRLHYAEKPFDANRQSFQRGSVIILKSANEKYGTGLLPLLKQICDTAKIQLIPVTSGMVEKGLDFGSSSFHPLKAVKVAMLTGEEVSATAAGEIWNLFDNELSYKLTLINAGDYNRIDWKEVDVLILPDGKYSFLSNKESAEDLEQWIRKGGKVIALENAAAQLSKQSWSAVHLKIDSSDADSSKKNPYVSLKVFEDRERSQISEGTPGAIYRVNVDNTHPLMFGYPGYYYTLKMDTVLYKFIKKDGWNAGVLKKQNQVAGFVGYKLSPKLQDGLLFGVQDLGRGNIVYLADDVLFRNFWENGKLMFCNAVFLVGR